MNTPSSPRARLLPQRTDRRRHLLLAACAGALVLGALPAAQARSVMISLARATAQAKADSTSTAAAGQAFASSPDSPNSPKSPVQRQGAAFEALRQGRHAEAYGRFAALADEGDAGSAVMALALVRHGASIGSQDWSATPGQLRRWSALAAQDLREQAPAIAGRDRVE